MARALAAGDLDRRIRIQSEITVDPGVGSGSSGEQTSTWRNLIDVWAQQIPLRASEAFQANQVVAGVDVVFRIRRPPTETRRMVTPEHTRVIDEDGRIFDVLGVQQIGREGLELQAHARGETVVPGAE
ncbi:MAG: head-tail adaptor protein [Gemmatimonadales bacterium]|nr:head-tail adaptor protein [Gemmatimonadales bacterium]